MKVSDMFPEILNKTILNKKTKIGVFGLGYVGLPLVMTFCRKGFACIGFDVDETKITALQNKKSYIRHIPDQAICELVGSKRFVATSDFVHAKDVDVLIICVPTPLSVHRDPDMSYVVTTTQSIAPHVRPGHLIILESTTYPGTMQQVVRPILEQSNPNILLGQDYFMAYSPEREDPGNPQFETATIPKVVGADDPASLEIAKNLYASIVCQVVPVSSSATAEAVKLTENIFRSVNIALVNELKVIYERMGIDIWEVIEAAKSKPFGFMPFYPGPGLGGHCIPIDPFYLAWKAKEYGISTRFIELAGQINTHMPDYVIEKLREGLDRHLCKGLNGTKILILGIAYKKNVDDMRESPALVLLEKLEALGARTDYHDPFIPKIPLTREHANLAGRISVPLTSEVLKAYDCVLIVTDHDVVDYDHLVRGSRLVIDTRNTLKHVSSATPVVKA